MMNIVKLMSFLQAYLSIPSKRQPLWFVAFLATWFSAALPQAASAQSACIVGEMDAYPATYYEDFGTGGRTTNGNVLNHGYSTPTQNGGQIYDDWYAVGTSADLEGFWMKTNLTGNGDADGATGGRYLAINMRGRNEPSGAWEGEFYRVNGISLLPAGLPAGASVGGFQYSTALVGTCDACEDIPNFTLIVENNANGAELGSQTSSSIGVANNDVWNTASLTVAPVAPTVTAVNLVLFNSQPEGDDGNDVGVDNVEFEPLICLPPELDFTKSAVTINDVVGDAGLTEAGDTIRYTYTLTNNDDTTAYNVSLTETTFTGTGTAPTPTVLSGGADLDGGDGTATDVAPGATLVFTFDYTVTQADIDAGFVDNQATANFEDLIDTGFSTLSDGDAGTSGAQVTRVPLVQSPALTLTKTADTSGVSSPLAIGDPIVYTFTVVNTGNVGLTLSGGDTMTYRTDGSGAGVATALVLAEVSESITDNDILEVGETTIFEATYSLDQAAIDAGGLYNTATVTGNPVDESGADLGSLSDVMDVSDNSGGDGCGWHGGSCDPIGGCGGRPSGAHRGYLGHGYGA